MTLILAMSKPEGIYLSADFRVTDVRNRQILDDAAPKVLTVQFPPIEGGTRGLIAFTGLARLLDGTPIMTWLRQTIRGVAQFPDEVFAHLRERLDRDIGPLGIGLIINALLVEGALGERRLFGGFTNLKQLEPGRPFVPQGQFEYLMQELHGPAFFANGSGTPAISPGDHELIRHQLEVRPGAASEHMGLLAAINRRVSGKARSVSPACHVAFQRAAPMQPGETDRQFGSLSKSFAKRGEQAPLVLPSLLGALDLTELMEDFIKNLEKWKEGEEFAVTDKDEMNRRIQRRP